MSEVLPRLTVCRAHTACSEELDAAVRPVQNASKLKDMVNAERMSVSQRRERLHGSTEFYESYGGRIRVGANGNSDLIKEV
jgi:hypothetical protein